MKYFTLLLPLLPFIHSSPTSPSRSRIGTLFNAASREVHRRDVAREHRIPRLILYVQNEAYVDGTPLSLLPLLEEHTRVTHVIISSFHINRVPGDIALNDDLPSSPIYDRLWPEVKTLQSHGVKVMAMLGGAGGTTYLNLSGNDTMFETYYQPLLSLIRQYSFDGMDVDIEEPVDVSIALRLLKALRRDMGPDFMLTMAPIASAMIYNNGINLSGFSYFDLEANAIDPSGNKIVSWYNAQFYSGFGDAGSPDDYQFIINKGWDPTRVVFGVLDSPSDGAGFVDTHNVVKTIKQLRAMYPTFGGVSGWDYFNAGVYEGGDGPVPWIWVNIIRDALYGWLKRSGLMRHYE